MRYFTVFVEKALGFYTYKSQRGDLEVGDRVFIKFRKKQNIGVIIAEEKERDYPFEVLEIDEKIEDGIKFSKEIIKLLVWIKNYYLCGFEQVYTAAIPSNLKIKHSVYYQVKKIEDLKENTDIYDFFKKRYFSRKKVFIDVLGKEKFLKYLEKKIIKEEDGWYCPNEDILIEDSFLREYIVKKKSVLQSSLKQKFSENFLNKLLKEGKIYLEKRYKTEDKKRESIEKKDNMLSSGKFLNEEQQGVVDGILNSEKKYFLIRGITGSGKTEVYIKIIKEELKKGKGAIFLVPEISLTPQMVRRFKNEFFDEVAILHSRLSDKEREEEWLAINDGSKKIVLGVRSAIFAPVKNLGCIIVDEEHENSYKQDSAPRYNAKYVALKRGEIEGAKIILGSATPSVESYYYAKKGLFELYELKKRYNNQELPEIEIVDMKEEKDSFFSESLKENIRKTLLKGEQVIILQNRKGYSTLVQCKECGHIEECEHCSIKLNYYASQGVLKCNYCGISKRFTGKCPKCGKESLEFSGRGTEKIEEELRKIFPVNILRVDGEAAKEKGFYERMFKEFSEGKYQIMIGTQMISRGLHFPNVTLVGVINSDLLMNIPDFRSGERTYQLITQVSGRAGRGDKKGKVIVQTYQPENYIIEEIKKTEYEEFYKKEIEKREILDYPPFSKIINIGISSIDDKEIEIYAQKIYNEIKEDGIEFYGPMRSLVYKVKGRYRYNIFIKGERKKINEFKKKLVEKIKKIENKKYRVVVDIDPINLI